MPIFINFTDIISWYQACLLIKKALKSNLISQDKVVENFVLLAFITIGNIFPTLYTKQQQQNKWTASVLHI